MKLQLQTRLTGANPGLRHRLAFCQGALEHISGSICQLRQRPGLAIVQMNQQLPFSVCQLNLLKLLGDGGWLQQQGLNGLARFVHMLGQHMGQCQQGLLLLLDPESQRAPRIFKRPGLGG